MKHGVFTDEQIAEVCHAANMVIQKHLHDEAPSRPWEEEADFVRKASVRQVQMVLAGHSPEETHNEWCDRLFDQGYICGLVKSREMKTHPCLVPFRDLPVEQKRKVRMNHAIVLALAIDY